MHPTPHRRDNRSLRGARRRTITFRQYYADYTTRQIWSPQTARAVDLAARAFPFAEVPMRRLTPVHIETWVKKMHDKGLAAATIRTRFANIRAILYAAQRDGAITHNPCTGVRLPRAKGRATTASMPTPAQVDQLVRTSPAPYDRLFAICAYAGLRLGEARALTWSDIDQEAGTIRVQRQSRLVPGGGFETTPPKYGSYRVVPMSAPLFDALSRRPTPKNELVVPGAGGEPVHPGSVARVWKHQKTSCGLPHALRLHDLRHFYASSLIASGENVLTIQRRLGHARASTTLDVYGHALDWAN
ncbi:tyrosine-type recombinase/integrase [Demequina sp. SYSU T00068]|uniref:tyrosine-type recombinase/integrase n=1 Tax=Demequina lignilytica TaxID=3051663 RepID=UPI0026190F63|nr:site-specific integrase [Demequina sp. SYSU T00068]MDN4489248.1 tyrosine-type recombinase/integrase [Demequina sp. SYSU T00068]